MSQDLNNQELDELDQLLAETPEPLEPLDLVMLDGYLCGVLVQPRLVPAEQWLPPVFDLEGRPLPEGTDPARVARVAALVERRQAALNRMLAEDGWFDPIVHDEPELATDSAGADLLRELPAPSRPLFSWSAGFQYATVCFPELLSAPDERIDDLLDRVFRHLPPQDDEERAALRRLDAGQPLRSVDEAVEDLVLAVADLWELTREARYRVDTVRRDQPKVGRNDPCPCGSGRKFKQCHGK